MRSTWRAVKRDHQNQGIGSKLIRYWLDKFDVEKHNLVVVLGHPKFYSKFGFAPSKRFGISWEQDVPDDIFMVKELKKGALSTINGIVKYHPAFNNV
ncbi:MAG: GNAT family N-acetyltransferase [Nitrospinota bacterium]